MIFDFSISLASLFKYLDIDTAIGCFDCDSIDKIISLISFSFFLSKISKSIISGLPFVIVPVAASIIAPSPGNGLNANVPPVVPVIVAAGEAVP